MDDVYMVAAGCYSDYHVVGIFSSKKNAKMFISEVYDGGGGKAIITRMPLNPHIDDINNGLKLYFVTMDIDGNTEKIEESKCAYYDDDHLRVWKKTKANFWRKVSIADVVTGAVWAKDEKHAIKIANEFRTGAILRGEMTRRIIEKKESK